MGRLYNFITGFIPGAFAGTLYVLVTQPINEIKFRMNNYPDDYKGYFNCIKKTIRSEGFFRGLYSRSVLSLYVHVAENAILFGVLGECAALVRSVTQKDEMNELSLLEKSICGSLASICTSFLHCPATVLSQKLEDVWHYDYTLFRNNNYKLLKPPIGEHALIISLIRREGFHNLYKNYFRVMLREMYGVFFYFGGFYASRDLVDLIFEPDELTLPQIMLSGGVGGASYWIFVNPIIIVQSRMNDKSQHFLSVLFQIIKKYGVMELFQGLRPILLIAVPTNALIFGAICSFDNYLFEE